MRILQVNTVCGNGSVGKIAADLSRVAQSVGETSLAAYGRRKAPDNIETVKFGTRTGMGFHVLKTFFTGKHGFGSGRDTEKFLREAKAFGPDLIHLHNIHGFYLQVQMLFDYIRQEQLPVVWTLHDCWSFTGHCAYYDYVGCSKWTTHCEHCPQNRKAYPYSLFKDNSRGNFTVKRELFTGVDNLTIVTPSRWLAGEVKKSYLKDYRVETIPNGIDLEKFHPYDIKENRFAGLKQGKLVLGVANIWEKRKGLSFFVDMADKLGADYQILLVGLSKKQIKDLPAGVIGIERTETVPELAMLYSLADVYVNATLEDNFPTTNLEALACGTPVITFATGGSPESIDESCGRVVEKGNGGQLLKNIKVLCEQPLPADACRRRSENYDKNKRFLEYIDLYRQMAGE